ncbi:MAG: hypothetical protein AAF518_08775 [Spirochaetota bacterium]
MLTFLIVCIFYTINSPFASADKYLRWKRIPGAHGYQVQIRNAKRRIVIDKKISQNKYPAYKLPGGRYTCRVAPLNVFKKPVVWSTWSSLAVLQRKKPELLAITPRVLLSGSKNRKLQLRGKNFVGPVKVKVYANGRSIPVKKIRTRSEKVVSLSLDLRRVRENYYHIRVENANGKRVLRKKILRIRQENQMKPLSPVDTKVEVSEGKPIRFAWQKFRGADYYRFRILQKKSKGSKEILRYKTRRTEYKLNNFSKLQRGKFVWEVTPYNKKNQPVGKQVRSPFEIDAKKQAKGLQPDDIQIISPDILYKHEK